MARIRTFIAVDVGAPIRQRAAALQERLASSSTGVKWVEEGNLHITLLFLGEVDELEVVSICRIVKREARTLPVAHLEIAGVGAFPTLRRPKILWAGVTAGAAELKQIHDRLEGPLAELGCYRREDRPYAPHLTLGRLTQEDRREEWGPILTKNAGWEAGSATIDEILVMSSELRRGGPVYTVMGRGRLGGKADEADEEFDADDE